MSGGPFSCGHFLTETDGPCALCDLEAQAGQQQPDPPYEELCRSEGHPFADGDRRCYCGERDYRSLFCGEERGDGVCEMNRGHHPGDCRFVVRKKIDGART